MKQDTSTSTNDNKSGSGVQELISKYIDKVDEKGKLQLPDDLSDVEKELIRQAKRTRDAQRALSKAQLERERLAKEKEELEKIAREAVPADFQLTPEQIEEIEKLKFTDPEEYRIRVNKLEEEARRKQDERLREIQEKARQEAENMYLSQTRQAVLEEFRKANPDVPITDEVLANDVPPRFTKELNEGKYDYETYLQKVAQFLRANKVVAGKEIPDTPDLGNLAGATTPGKVAAEKQGKVDYKKLTF